MTARTRSFCLLQVALILFSLGSVCSKKAAGHDYSSFPFLFWYGLLIIVLVVYAALWQRVLRHLELTIAYASKSLVIIWSLLWAILIFGETITWTNFLGATVIIVGVILTGTE